MLHEATPNRAEPAQVDPLIVASTDAAALHAAAHHAGRHADERLQADARSAALHDACTAACADDCRVAALLLDAVAGGMTAVPSVAAAQADCWAAAAKAGVVAECHVDELDSDVAANMAAAAGAVVAAAGNVAAVAATDAALAAFGAAAAVAAAGLVPAELMVQAAAQVH